MNEYSKSNNSKEIHSKENSIQYPAHIPNLDHESLENKTAQMEDQQSLQASRNQLNGYTS